MEAEAQRAALMALVERQDASLAELSRVIGRNAAYLQQYVRRGTPRMLAERDRERLARYFGVPEAQLGAREAEELVEVARLDIGASAGSGRLADGELARQPGMLSPALLRQLGVRAAAASMIRVEGDSMEPTLFDGDEILVDGDRREVGARGGVYVIRVEGELMVKRLRPAVGGVDVASDNPAYPPRFFRSGQLEIVGRVAWLSRAVL
jgi:phage repressor protein C with HTH and peptisase S24 domain